MQRRATGACRHDHEIVLARNGSDGVAAGANIDDDIDIVVDELRNLPSRCFVGGNDESAAASSGCGDGGDRDG